MACDWTYMIWISSNSTIRSCCRHGWWMHGQKLLYMLVWVRFEFVYWVWKSSVCSLKHKPMQVGNLVNSETINENEPHDPEEEELAPTSPNHNVILIHLFGWPCWLNSVWWPWAYHLGTQFNITNQSRLSMYVLGCCNSVSQRMCLSLWFRSVRTVVYQSCCGLAWGFSPTLSLIEEVWFTVAVSVVVDLISLSSKVCLSVAGMPRMNILDFPRVFDCIILKCANVPSFGSTVTASCSMLTRSEKPFIVFQLAIALECSSGFSSHQREGDWAS